MSKTLDRLVRMADVQVSIESDIEKLEAELKERKAALRKVSEEDLPDLMIELGITEFKLASGKVVKIKPDFYTKIPDARWAEAVAWLDGRGFSGIIKSIVTAPFGLNEKERAEELLENLHEHGVSAELKQTIHPGTLKSFVKEQLSKEERIPFDLFGIVPFNKSIIS